VLAGTALAAEGGGQLSVRTFTVQPGMTCLPPIQWDTPEQREENNAKWRALFSEGGVTWPEGSYRCHVPAFDGLVVKTTAENLDIIAALCRSVEPKRIHVSAQLWLLEPQTARELGLDDAVPAVIPAADWLKLRNRLAREGEAGFLASPSVVVGNHEEATLDGKYECRLPLTGKAATESDGEAVADGDEPYEVGGRLQVVPSVGRDEEWTSLQVALAYDFPPILSGGSETGKVAAVHCPAFRFQSTLTLKRDEVAVVGGFPVETSAASGRRLLFAFLRAQ
jgi:hypothetical protein